MSRGKRNNSLPFNRTSTGKLIDLNSTDYEHAFDQLPGRNGYLKLKREGNKTILTIVTVFSAPGYKNAESSIKLDVIDTLHIKKLINDLILAGGDGRTAFDFSKGTIGFALISTDKPHPDHWSSLYVEVVSGGIVSLNREQVIKFLELIN